MIDYRNELNRILSSKNHENLIKENFLFTEAWTSADLANMFVDTIYLQTVINVIKDEHYLKSKNSTEDVYFERFIKKFLGAELKPLLYLHKFFSSTDLDGINKSETLLEELKKYLLREIKSQTYDNQKIILQISLKKMSDFFEVEHQLNFLEKASANEAKMSLYRTFDVLDEIFGLDYILDETPDIHQKERLYESAGVGVQSSYATTLLALRYLNLPKGSKFIDLGSGYGRVGLVVGLLRPDIQFTGYEFVKERVDIANRASTNLNMNSHVEFLTQDLVQENFKIPLADTYYIFDSFTDSSYVIIMEQLQELTYQKRITVVTKGNARQWMKKTFWTEPQEFYGGNICFFRSTAKLSTR